MPRVLPPSPSLEQLKNQAKDLLKALRARDLQALLRIEQQLPYHSAAAALSDAQLVIAREYGFASWPKLKRHVTALVVERQALIPTSTEQAGAVTSAGSQRKRRIEQLAARITELADQQAIEQLLPCLWIPARDLLELRAQLVQSGAYTLLVDALLKGVDNEHARVRFDAAQAMDHFADERCAAPLRRLLSDPVPRVRWAALHSLSCEACKLAPIATNNDLVELVIELALNDPSIRVRRVAAYTLGGDCYDPRAVAAIEQLLARETDEAILRSARRALGQQKRLATQTIRAQSQPEA